METLLPTRLAVTSASALLLFSTDCSTLPDPLGCRLTNFLHILYIAAAILGVGLLIVAILAYRTYRQNKIDAAEATRPEKHSPENTVL